MKSKENSFWTMFAIFAFVLLGGSGFYCYTAYSEFKEADSGYTNLKDDAETLLSAKIHPTEANRKELADKVEAYKGEVDKLHDALSKFAKDLEPMRPRDFQETAKNEVEAIRALALDPNSPVALPDGFYLGFEDYRSDVPRDEKAAGILKYQLDAIVHVVRTAMDNGAVQIYALQRQYTPQEEGKPDPEETEIVAKYPFTFSFRTTHEGFQDFVNQISNDDQYFFIIRVLRVDNEKKEGPEREYEQGSVYVDKDGNPVVELPEGADESEFQLQDAKVIFGEERLRITAVIDLCRFPKQKEGDAPAAAEEENS